MKGIKDFLGRKPPNKDDWTKLDQRVWHAVAMDQPAKLATKLNKHDVNINKLCPSVGYSIVHYAASKGLDDCLNVLLANNADISTKDITGATPLHVSSRYGHKGTTTKLLASSTVDVNARDNNHYTALHFASFQGHLDCVELIANHKEADINCINKDGRTALMVAAAMGMKSVCLELLRRGIDVNWRDTSELKHSALTLAAEAGHAEVVRLLCENGADYSAKLTDHRDALDVARGKSRRAVIDVLHVIQLAAAVKISDPKSARRLSQSTVLEDALLPNTKTNQKAPHLKQNEPPHVSNQHRESVTSSNSSSSRQSTNQAKVQVIKHQHQPKPAVRKSGKQNDLRYQETPPSKRTEVLKNVKSSSSSSSGKSKEAGKGTATQAIYNDSKLIDKCYREGEHVAHESSIYGSKSTLASVSSIDTSLDPNSTPGLNSRIEYSKQKFSKLADELAQLKEQNSSLRIRLKKSEESNFDIETIRNEYKKQRHSMQVLEKDNITLASKCKHLRDNYEKLTCEYNDQQSELATFEKKSLILVGKVDQLRADRDKGATANKMLRTELEKLHVENEKLASKEVGFQKHIEKVNTENGRLKEQLSVQAGGGDEVNSLRADLESSREENLSLKVQHNKLLARMDREQEQLEQQLVMSKDELRTLKMQVEKEKENLQHQSLESQKQKALLDEKIGALENNLKNEVLSNEKTSLELKSLVEMYNDDLISGESDVDSIKKLLEDRLNIKKTRSAEIREAESSLQTSFEEVELLRLKIAEQEKEISLLNSNLSSTEQKLFIANTENKNLAQTLVKAKVIRSSKFDFDALSSSVDDQTSNLNKSQQESKLQAENIDEIQSELSKIMMINDKLELKLCEEKNNNEKLVSSLQNEMKALKDKCSVMEKLHLKQDKQISELTMERNQREAKVGEMEKRAKRAEAKCKECEVDSNRIRQYLAMATSKNQQLTNQFVKSRKENESMKKVFSMKTVDSLQSKLDELANAMKEKEISHKKTIDIYRQHLYNAYQGTLDPEVVSVLEEIKETKIREENEIKAT